MRCLAVILLLWLVPTPAFAQLQRVHWGATVSITPHWEVPTQFKKLFDADSLTVQSRDLKVGILRGSTFGGEWGIVFLNRTLSDETLVARPSSSCAGCGTFYTSAGSKLTGAEAYRFLSMATIAERIQIGMNVAGGVAVLRGKARERRVSPDIISESDVEASVLFSPWGKDISVVPLARAEVAVAAILAPDIKLRLASGFDFPGYNRFNLGVVYLFGAR